MTLSKAIEIVEPAKRMPVGVVVYVVLIIITDGAIFLSVIFSQATVLKLNSNWAHEILSAKKERSM